MSTYVVTVCRSLVGGQVSENTQPDTDFLCTWKARKQNRGKLK